MDELILLHKHWIIYIRCNTTRAKRTIILEKCYECENKEYILNKRITSLLAFIFQKILDCLPTFEILRCVCFKYGYQITIRIMSGPIFRIMYHTL